MMRNHSIKKSIDSEIGEQPWLTDQLVKKLASGKPAPIKRAWPAFLRPTVTLAAISFIAIFIYVTNPSPTEELPFVTANQIDWTSLEVVNVEDEVKSAFTQYIETILAEDYGGIESVSQTETTASPKELFERYKTIDLSSFRIVSVTQSRGEPMTIIQAAYRMGEIQEEVLQTYFIDASKGDQIMVSEDIYTELPTYTPYQFPEQITLNYDPVIVLSESAATFSSEEIVTQASLPSGEELIVTTSSEYRNDLWLNVEGEHYLLTKIDSVSEDVLSLNSISFQGTESVGYQILSESLGSIGLVFLGDQVQFIETVPEQVWNLVDVNDDGKNEWLLADDSVLIVRLHENELQIAKLLDQLQATDFSENLFQFSLEDQTIYIQAKLYEGEREAVFTFTELETLSKINH